MTQEHVRNTQNKEIYLPQICINAAYATAPTWSCLKQLQCYKEEDRNNNDAQSDWSCPACHDLSLDDKVVRLHASQHELLKVTWSPTWEPKELLHSWASFQQMTQIYETKQIAPFLDEGLDDLERQGFCTSINHRRWKSTQGKEIEIVKGLLRYTTNQSTCGHHSHGAL